MSFDNENITQKTGKNKVAKRFGFKLNEIIEIEENIIIYDFLIEGGFNVLAAPPSSGKTLFAYYLAVSLLTAGRNIVYVDFDNPIDVPKRRNLPQKIREIGKEEDFVYLNSTRYLQDLSSGKVKNKVDFLSTVFGKLKGIERDTIVFIDSLQNFVQKTTDETEMGNFLNFLKLMTMDGVTVFLIHHFSRAEKHIKGDSRIIDLPDAAYVVSNVRKESGEITSIEIKQEKKKYSEMADQFVVDFMDGYNFEIATDISEKEREVIIIIRSLAQKGISEIQQKDLKKRIKEKVRIGNTNLQIILKHLVEQGFIEERREGKKVFCNLDNIGKGAEE